MLTHTIHTAETTNSVYSFFEYLTNEQINMLIENSSVCYYSKKTMLFLQDSRTSHIMYIKTGLVKTFYYDNKTNDTILLDFIVPGNFINLTTCLGSEKYAFSAEAIEHSEILLIDPAVFLKIIHENERFSIVIFKQINSMYSSLVRKLHICITKQLAGKIADILLFFSEKVYKSNIFAFPVTRRELAQLIGVTTEGFIRVLMEFKKDRIISIEKSKIIINSIDIIKKISSCG